MKNVFIILFLFTFFISTIPANAVVKKVEGIEYSLRKVTEIPMAKYIRKNYDLYEFYIENNSLKAFSVPGYSIDVGVSHTNIARVKSKMRSRTSKQLAVLNVAASAASFALGGGVVTGASRVVIGGIRRYKRTKYRKGGSSNDEMLNQDKTYILYPGDKKYLYFLVEKSQIDAINTVRFICRDEENLENYIVINKDYKYTQLDVSAEVVTNPDNPINLINNQDDLSSEIRDYFAVKNTVPNEFDTVRLEDRYIELHNFDSVNKAIAYPGPQYY